MKAQPLTPHAFAPFGDVVSTARLSQGKSANQGTGTRLDFVAQLASTRPAAKANMVVFRCNGQALPFHVKLLEQHPHSSQTFLPLKCERYLVCVAPTGADGLPVVSALQAFIGEAGQGVNYAPGTWHHPMVSLGSDGEFAMLVWEDQSAGDCVEWPLPDTAFIEVT
ncbi:MAG: ureidoglycolate lyase [Myxococcaceae bacterium]|nr:ureidoglycolate lyase [Myxococcaceae bacterium]